MVYKSHSAENSIRKVDCGPVLVHPHQCMCIGPGIHFLVVGWRYQYIHIVFSIFKT